MTGALRSTVDRVWDAFWTGGISNPLEVLEQITYLLFVRRLDEFQTVRDRTCRRGVPDSAPFFGPDQQDLRWGNFKDVVKLPPAPRRHARSPTLDFARAGGAPTAAEPALRADDGSLTTGPRRVMKILGFWPRRVSGGARLFVVVMGEWAG
ncbi:type I restriction-modification system subunit M N-terminal domain-containing protein, partial [Streptomyces sp. NPDC004393]